MFISVAIVVVHVRLEQPENKLFVIPFLAIYLIFTIFEIYILDRVGKAKPSIDSERKYTQT